MIVVVGASSHIGLTILPPLMKKDNVIAGVRSVSKLYDFKDENNLDVVELDLLSSESIENFCTVLKKVNDKITFINLAAVSIDNLFLKYTAKDWNTVQDVNINSCNPILQILIPKMIRTGWGRIINVSSVTSDLCPIGASAYSVSKAALIALSRSLAHEYGRFGITSNTIVLGYMDTGLTSNFTDERKEYLLNNIPLKKFGSANEVYLAIEYMMKSEFLNGTEIRIDGGMHFI